MNDKFNFVMPADLIKGEDGEWKVAGLASTQRTDQQGEILVQAGIDCSPIDKKKGYFNLDHQPGISNLLGTIDSYRKDANGLYVEGRLFKNSEKAKAVYDVMSSLGKSDRGRVGLSVQGKVLERDKKNPKIIKKCVVDQIAITLHPVNQDTYADLIKSFGGADVEFNSTEESNALGDVDSEAKVFSASEVVQLIQKALGIGSGVTAAPGSRTGGDALSQEELDADTKRPPANQTLNDDAPKAVEAAKEEKPVEKPARKAPAKTTSKDLYKSHIDEIMNKIQGLYPNNSREEIWAAVKDRLSKRFPALS